MTEDPFPTAESVKVLVRVRPSNDKEIQQEKAIFASSNESTVRVRGGERGLNLSCVYDAVLDENATQAEVYQHLQSSIEQVAQGFNTTIFAYGQTGTGKTHTMLGKNLEKELQQLTLTETENWGVIPRAIDGLFHELEQVAAHGTSAVVHCSYMQIYNNEVYDLLQESKNMMKEPLIIREMVKGNSKQIYVSGVSEFRVENAQAVLRLIQQGGKNRHIRATECNEQSSRSHAVLQLAAEVESRGSECTTIIRRAKLNLVDLAGSEKWNTDIEMGKSRTAELKNINQSLSALGNVISALTERRRSHIPYRDSKLTRLLQDSLGGNTRTTVIATLSPSAGAIEESVSTLQFADRAKRVMMRVKVNEMVDDAVLLARAQAEIARLKVQLRQKESEKVTNLESHIKKLKEQMTSLQNENASLRRELQSAVIKPQAHLRSMDRSDSFVSQNGIEDESNHNTHLELTKLREELSGNSDEPAVKVGSNQIVDAQTEAIRHIQEERRRLEQELEQFDGEPEEDDNEEDELCPMCNKNIDDHTDEQLDHCIEAEAKAMEELEQGQQDSEAEEQHRSSDIDSLLNSNLDQRGEELLRLSNEVLSSNTKKPALAKSRMKKTKSKQKLAIPTAHTDQIDALAQIENALNAIDDADGESREKIESIRQQTLKKKRKAKKKMLKPRRPVNAAKPPKRMPPRPVLNQERNAGDGGMTLTYSNRDIGLRASIYKYRYDCWYPCVIVGFDSQRLLHCCHFDFGDKQWQDLGQRNHKILGKADDEGGTKPEKTSANSNLSRKSLTPAARKRLSETRSAYGSI